PEAELALIDEAVAAYGDEASLPRSQGGWESVGEGMIGAYVDRCTSRIVSLEPSGARVASASVDEASGLLATLLERLGVPVVEEGAALSLSISTDGRALSASVPEERVRSVLAGALSTSPTAPTGPGLYCVDPAFVLDADGLCAAAALAMLGV
ncbi:MAG: phosphomannomutase, partial [Actinomyces sp.]